MTVEPPTTARVSIRPAGATDLAEIEQLARAIWPVVYRDVISDAQIDYMLSWMYSQETLAWELADGVRFDLLEIDGEAVGYVSYGPIRPGAMVTLHKLYLMPGCHGQGLGSLLLRHAEAVCYSESAAGMELRVNRRNARAIRTYCRNGWRLDREDCCEIGGGFVMDDFVFTKKLPDWN